MGDVAFIMLVTFISQDLSDTQFRLGVKINETNACLRGFVHPIKDEHIIPLLILLITELNHFPCLVRQNTDGFVLSAMEIYDKL